MFNINRLFPLIGILSPEVLLAKLRRASQDGDIETLEGVINECVSAGMPVLDSAVQQARQLVDDLEEMPRRGGHIYIAIFIILVHIYV